MYRTCPDSGFRQTPHALDVEQHAATEAVLLDTLGVAPVAIISNSFGCQVAVEIALRRPDLVVALVLVGPTTDPAAATMTGQIWRFLRNLVHEDWHQIPILVTDLRDADPRRILRTLRHAVTDESEPKLSRARRAGAAGPG